MGSDLSGCAVLFDLDGTLVDTADDLAASMNHALARAGLSAVEPERVRHLVGRGARRMLQRGFEISHGSPPDDSQLDKGLAIFLEHYEENIAIHSMPFDGVTGLIASLRKRGAKIAVCTNKREALTRLLLSKLNLAGLIDVVAGADTAQAPKPDPAPVLYCLERSRSEKGVLIGDSDTDILAAAAARMPCLIAQFGYGPLERIRESFGVLRSYKDAEPLIIKALGR